MVRLFVRHRVTDYPAWRKAYDEFDTERRSLGALDHAVFQSVGDPSDVTVWTDFESSAAADSFTSSPQLRAAMERAGVDGAPQIWSANPA